MAHPESCRHARTADFEEQAKQGAEFGILIRRHAETIPSPRREAPCATLRAGHPPNCPPLQPPCKVAALFVGTPRMARDQVDMTPIETREELIAWFEAGSKPKSQFRIGTEHEKFVFTVERHNPVPYDGRREHSRTARRHAASARLGTDRRGRQHHRPVRRDRRRRDLARAGRPVRAFGRAGRDRASDLLGAHGASGAGQGSRAAARHRLSRAGHDAELEPRRDPDDAQGPLPHHDGLHAEGGPTTAST